MMTKSAFTTYKPHMSREVPPVGEPTGGAGPAAPGESAVARRRRNPGLVFAPVRPGIVAACMVEPLDSGRVPGTDRPRWIGQSETDKRNILPMTGKGSDSCQALRNFRSGTTGQGARPALGYVE
jgi:hypothetical protein